LPFLKDILSRETGIDDVRRFPYGPRNDSEAALSAMLETREREALKCVWERRGDEAIHHLLNVGFEGPEQQFRKLYTDTIFHLCFPAGFFRDEAAPVHLVKRNPTWRPRENVRFTGKFGGQSERQCASCGDCLHHVLTLNPLPDNLGVTGLNSLSLETCLSCLGWEERASNLFYRHDELGRPTALAAFGNRVKPQFPAEPLLAAEIILSPTPRRWFWQDWALSNSRENLNRIGGHPAWIQNADYLTCPICTKRMQHLLQLDSDLTTVDGGQWLWGSGGCCYVGWCDKCKASGFQWQCT
jgi:hypothetical protein